MKIYNTVQNKEEAEKLIRWAYSPAKKNFNNGKFEMVSCQCECGETSLLKYTVQSITEPNVMATYSIAICSSCGEEDAYLPDVLNIRVW